MAKPITPPEDKLELYDKILASKKITRKGKTMAYTSLNGNMYSYMDKTGSMALRLPKEEREEFLSKFKTKLDVQYNTVMKEYAKVPDTILENTKTMKKYFAISYKYVKSLKPKPTKKKAK